MAGRADACHRVHREADGGGVPGEAQVHSAGRQHDHALQGPAEAAKPEVVPDELKRQRAGAQQKAVEIARSDELRAQDVEAARRQLGDDTSSFKIYPVARVSIGYRF